MDDRPSRTGVRCPAQRRAGRELTFVASARGGGCPVGHLTAVEAIIWRCRARTLWWICQRSSGRGRPPECGMPASEGTARGKDPRYVAGRLRSHRRDRLGGERGLYDQRAHRLATTLRRDTGDSAESHLAGPRGGRPPVFDCVGGHGVERASADTRQWRGLATCDVEHACFSAAPPSCELTPSGSNDEERRPRCATGRSGSLRRPRPPSCAWRLSCRRLQRPCEPLACA